MGAVLLRKFLVILAGLAFLMGSEAQAAAPLAGLMARSHTHGAHAVMGDDCATMAMQGAPLQAPTKHEPCKPVSKQGCICTPALLTPTTPLATPFAWGRFSYGPLSSSALVGRSIKPNLDPPIAI